MVRLDRRRWLAGAAAMALGAAPLAQAQAQTASFPTKTITLVVGYPPGGSTDLTGRIVAAELARRLGQQVIVENIGGAGGTLGAQKVAQAAPDGYTLLLGSNNEMAISGLVSSAARYDPLRQFTPIGLVASQPMVLVAGPRAGVKNIAEFVQAVKNNPGKYSFGSSGIGTALHLAGEMVKQASGIYMVHIPYRGVAPLITDLIGGQLEYGVFVLSSGLPLIRSGKVVALGTTEAQRSAAAPEVPALAEYPPLKSVDISTWFGLWGPAGLPPAVLQRLRGALADSLAAPEVRAKFAESGATVFPPGGDLARFQAGEIAKYRGIVEFAKIRE